MGHIYTMLPPTGGSLLSWNAVPSLLPSYPPPPRHPRRAATSPPASFVTQLKLALTALVPLLRLVSQWNVCRRRFPSVARIGGEPLGAASPPGLHRGGRGGRRRHFCGRQQQPRLWTRRARVGQPDRVTLAAAQNGEAYYVHLTSERALKLNKFGPGADGLHTRFQRGAPLGGCVIGGIRRRRRRCSGDSADGFDYQELCHSLGMGLMSYHSLIFFTLCAVVL